MEWLGEKTVRVAFHEAYDLATLKSASRTLSLENGAVDIEDTFAFEGGGLEVEEAFITWRAVDVEGAVARVRTENGVLEIRAESGCFTAERLEEACKANQKPGVLTRIAVTYPPQANRTVRFTMAFHPVP